MVQKKQEDSGEQVTKAEQVNPEKVQKVKKEKVVKSKTTGSGKKCLRLTAASSTWAGSRMIG